MTGRVASNASQLQPTRIRYAVLAFVFAAAFITYLDRVCISVAAPAMQADLHLSQLQFAWVFTVFNFAYGVFEIPTAWLGDRWGQRLMLIRIVGGWSLFGGGRRLSHSFPSTVTLVSAPREKPGQRHYVDGSPIRWRAGPAPRRGAHSGNRLAFYIRLIWNGGTGMVRRLRNLVPR